MVVQNTNIPYTTDTGGKENDDNYRFVHIAPVNYSVQRCGLEIYETDEENYYSYVSSVNAKGEKNVDKKLEFGDDNAVDEADEEDTTNSVVSGFKLHQGEIKETHYYDNLSSLNFESDYKEMTDSGSIKRNEVNLAQFYKGVRLKCLSNWEAPGYNTTWEDLHDVIEGYITDQSFTDEDVEIKISGMSVLLEQDLQFKFSQLPRSVILEEIIKTAGLIPVVDTEGLDDDVIDFSNEVKNNQTNSSNAPIGASSGNIAQLAQQVCQGKNSDYDKALAIHTYIRNHVNYPEPNYSNHRKCPMEVLKSGLSNCCDRARLGHEMANAVGLRNRGVHGPNHVWVQYLINGKWVDSDPGVSRPNLGAVYQGMGMDSEWSFPTC